MKTVDIAQASLAEYGRKTGEETWVLTRRGRPVAALVPIRRGLDLESFSLSHNPEFIDIINRSWADYKATGGVSLEALRRKHSIEPKPSHEAKRKAR